MPIIYDRAPENPSFENDLKDFKRKERQIESIYEAEIVPFLLYWLYCMQAGIQQDIKFKQYTSIGPLVIRSRDFCIKDAVLIKFRLKLPNRGKSAGGRLSAVVAIKEDCVVPLEIYSHSMRGNGDDTNDKELEKKFKAVYAKIQKTK